MKKSEIYKCIILAIAGNGHDGMSDAEAVEVLCQLCADYKTALREEVSA